MYIEETKYGAIILTTIGLVIAGMGIVLILGYLCSSKKPPRDAYYQQDDSVDQPNQRVNHSLEKIEQEEWKEEVIDLERPKNDIQADQSSENLLEKKDDE